MKCGLLGRKLGHSYSPQIHRHLGTYSYGLFEVEPEDLGNFLKHGDFHGLNVTMPYKKDVIPYLDEISPVAQALGAVNTIVRRPDGTLLGHNTDHFGFQTMLQHSGILVCGKKCLVLGSGGASNTVVQVLRSLGASVVVISRNGENNYTNLYKHADAALIVNATPVGMYPNNGQTPLSLDPFPHLEGVLDLIYNPARTQLLLNAKRRGLVAENGLLMLVSQAKEASEWFTNTTISNDRIHEIHRFLRQQMENIILIGMPGCGKSTIGKHLATQLGKTFADADGFIEKAAGKSIPDIFSQDGEARFRELETQVLFELGKQSGLVIATGGGCVTKERNEPLLHQNGIVFLIQRPLDLLPTNGRPLSQQNSLEVLFAQREPLYRQFADYTVLNDRNVEFVADQITKIWEELS